MSAEQTFDVTGLLDKSSFAAQLSSESTTGVPAFEQALQPEVEALLTTQEIRFQFSETHEEAVCVTDWVPEYVRTSLVLEKPNRERADQRVRALCDCGSSDDRCAHVAALIKHLTEHVSAPAPIPHEESAARWDNVLASLPPPYSTTDGLLPQLEVEAGSELLMILRPLDQSNFPMVTVEPRLITVPRSGAWARRRSTPLKLSLEGISPVPPTGYPREIERALSLLLLKAIADRGTGTTQDTQVTESIRVEGRIAVEAFDTLLSRIPALWNEDPVRLRATVPLSLNFAWIPLKDGSQRLVINAGERDRNALQLFQLGERAYIADCQTMSLHRLSHNVATVRAALSFPDLPQSLAYEVRERIASIPNLDLPLPRVDLETTEVRRPPTVRAIVEEHAVDYRFSVSLDFSYGGHRFDVEGADPHVIQHGHQVFNIHRDKAGERSIAARLADRLNLEGEDDTFWTDQHVAPTPFLLRAAAAFSELGIAYELPSTSRLNLITAIPQLHGELDSSADGKWFDIGLGIEFKGKRIPLLPLLQDLIERGQFTLEPGPDESPDATVWISIGGGNHILFPLQRLRGMISPIVAWLNSGTRRGRVRVPATSAASIERALEVTHNHFIASAKAQGLLERVRTARRHTKVPSTFKGSLRDYQVDGVNWMGYLADCSLGGILADGMGTGKTAQVLAHILSEMHLGNLRPPILIIAPLSATATWLAECEKFAPHLKVVLLHGGDRGELYAELKTAEIVVTTYETIVADLNDGQKLRFDLVVCDEARAIKTLDAGRSQTLRSLKAKRRLAVAATPIENNVGELFSVLDFVEPGILGTEAEFNDAYRWPIETHGDAEANLRLKERIAPLILRRLKDDVLPDLPPKTTHLTYLEMSAAQRDAYEAMRSITSKEVLDEIKKLGFVKSEDQLLYRLLRLRQLCNSPRLPTSLGLPDDMPSCKEQWLESNLPRFVQQGRRTLVFSQWNEQLILVGQMLDRLGIRYFVLNGKTQADRRRELVSAFNRGAVSVFLLNTIAGGVALNLQTADNVVHFDPHWNPSNEDQASDRAHRMGQTNEVNVYKLVVRGSVEEGILKIQDRKRALASAVLDGGDLSVSTLTETDLYGMLSPMPVFEPVVADD